MAKDKYVCPRCGGQLQSYCEVVIITEYTKLNKKTGNANKTSRREKEDIEFSAASGIECTVCEYILNLDDINRIFDDYEFKKIRK